LILAVLTGDIIASRSSPTAQWLPILQEALAYWGSTPSDWILYRGDSFQLKVQAPQALLACFLLKSALRSVRLDVRIGIGIGKETYSGRSLAESNGEAYILSGQAFDSLSQYNMALKSCFGQRYDEYWNLVLHLALTFADKWTVAESRALYALLQNPNLTQIQLAEQLGKAQSTISEALKRAHYVELKEMINIFKDQTEYKCSCSF
jgi:Trp operon repressor